MGFLSRVKKMKEEREKRKQSKKRQKLEKKFVKLGITNPDYIKLAINSEKESKPAIRKRIKLTFKEIKREIKSPRRVMEKRNRYTNYIFAKEMKKRGYSDEIIDEMLKRSPRERKKLLKQMKVKSVKIPEVGYRVNYKKFTEEEAKRGIEPRRYKLLETRMPKTIFFFIPTKIAKKYSDKKVNKEFEERYPEFIKNQEKVRKEENVSPKGVVTYAQNKSNIEANLKASKGISKKNELEYLKEFSEKRAKIKEEAEPVSVQLINFEKLKEEYKKRGKEIVLINDPEAKDSYMLFEKTKKEGLKPIKVPASAIKTVNLAKEELEKKEPAVKKVEEEYIEELLEKIEKEEWKKAAEKEKKKRLFFQRK